LAQTQGLHGHAVVSDANGRGSRMGVGAATLACCGGAGRDKGPVPIDPVLAAAVDLHFAEQASVRDLQRPRQFLFPGASTSPGCLNREAAAAVPATSLVLEPAPGSVGRRSLATSDPLAWSWGQENRSFGKSQQQESCKRMVEVQYASGVQVPTPTLEEFQFARLLEANNTVAEANGTKDGLESTKSPVSWHDAPCRRSSKRYLAGEERARSSNQDTQPRLGVRSITLDFGLSVRAAQASDAAMRPANDFSVPDPPVAWAASNAPRGYGQHESVQAKAACSFGQAQLVRNKTIPLGRQKSSGCGNGDTHCGAEWSGMAKRIQHQWNDANAEKRRCVFESAKLEDKLANYFQQQLIKERTGEGAVSAQQRPSPKGCGKIAIVDKALEIRLAQQRLKAEGQA